MLSLLESCCDFEKGLCCIGNYCAHAVSLLLYMGSDMLDGIHSFCFQLQSLNNSYRQLSHLLHSAVRFHLEIFRILEGSPANSSDIRHRGSPDPVFIPTVLGVFGTRFTSNVKLIAGDHALNDGLREFCLPTRRTMLALSPEQKQHATSIMLAFAGGFIAAHLWMRCDLRNYTTESHHGIPIFLAELGWT